MSKITYTNKVALNENNDIADINKVKADDMNEIKECVNNNDDMLTGGAVAGDMVVNSIRTKNMFDKNNIISGIRLGSTGETVNDANYFSSDFIPVKPNTTYTLSRNSSSDTLTVYCEYNSSKTFISRSSFITTTTRTFTTGSTTYFLKLSVGKINIDSLQLEEGSTATAYSDYQALNITQKEYSLTPVYTSNTPIYKLRRFGNMCVLEVNAMYFSSITANTWVSVASIPSEIIPSYSTGGALIQANSSNGNIEGYGRVELQNNGNIRVKTTSTSNAPFFTFTLLWFI
jgi:hypothetical protein